jgi:ABC-2 type transport system ATP-binding protein
MTVSEFLAHCARLRGVGARAARAAVARAQERCGLAEVGRRLLGNLSKGYRQRAGIAQAIVHEPEVVILDEPTSGLDPGQLRGIRELIRELGERHAVIFSTHVLPEVQSVCNRVHIIHEGRSALSAAMDALPGDDRRYRVRLARPPGHDALSAMPDVADAAPLDEAAWVLTVDGGAAGAERVARACVEHGLLEFTPLRQSLEDVFMTVCYADPAAPDEPGAGSPT